MTYFTPAIDKRFANWILPDTWHTFHLADMTRFYAFVAAIDRFSTKTSYRRVRARDLGFEDGDPDREIIMPPQSHPRTHDSAAMREKILTAVERNHPNFHRPEAERLAQKFTDMAMTILEYVWLAKHEIDLNDPAFRNWDPPLK